MKNVFNCYKITDTLDFEYIKTPKKLLHAKISPFARILCIAMHERLSLSVRNKWNDDDGNVYIIYTVNEAMELLGCSKPKAISVFAELDGRFIKRKRQGLCKPDIIYVNKISDKTASTPVADTDLSTDNVENIKSDIPESQNEPILNRENDISGTFKLNYPEVNIFNPNNINNNKNNINNNYLINPIYQYMDGG